MEFGMFGLSGLLKKLAGLIETEKDGHEKASNQINSLY
jgi:hypothetical protein